MASPAETSAMRRALALAATPGVPLGPNPRVGAVLVDAAGTVLAEGHHRGAGSPHAEIDALAHVGERARGATVIVTLEPCNHTGRTAPCAAALVEAGVSRVVFAQTDASPLARGGAETLRRGGVDVEAGLLSTLAAELNVAWSFAQLHGRPFVTWKFATSLDGRSAAEDGTSMWITGPEARADVHRLRAACDAIAVGTGTIEADNPQLTSRRDSGQPLPYGHQPLRVVIGTRALPVTANVFNDVAPTLVIATRDLVEALGTLYERHCQHVWLEGGPTLASAFMAGGLVDEVVAYVAPLLLGSGRSVLADLAISTIGDALRLRLDDVARLGDDVRLTLSAGT